MKASLKALLKNLGYKLTRLENALVSRTDPFAAMQQLLVGVKDPVIFDVGAHHGSVSLLYRRLFPTSTVYAFEPFPSSFQQLKANVESDPSIRVFNFGLSNRHGIQSLHSNTSSATNSLLATDELGSHTWGPLLLETQEIVEAEFKTVDTVMAQLKIPRIDILKLDVQGAEPLVIAGASSACRLGAIRLIYSELIIQPTYKNQMRFDDLLGVFYGSGYDLYNLYNMCFTPENRLCQVDAIFTQLVSGL